MVVVGNQDDPWTTRMLTTATVPHYNVFFNGGSGGGSAVLYSFVSCSLYNTIEHFMYIIVPKSTDYFVMWNVVLFISTSV